MKAYELRKKRLTIAMMSFFLVLMVSLQTAGLGAANPVPFPSTPILDDKPTITIETPTNNTAYSNSQIINITFSLNQADSWKKEVGLPFTIAIASASVVAVNLDGNIIFSVEQPINFTEIRRWIGEGRSACYAIPVQPSPGEHVLNVTVVADYYYRGPAYNGTHIVSDTHGGTEPVYEYPVVFYDTVYFTVEPAATPTPNPQETTTLTYTIVAIASLAIAVAATMLFIAKKSRSTKSFP